MSTHQPRVFCVQQQHRFDTQLGVLVPKFDLTSAHVHGEIEYLLSPTAAPFRSDSIVQELHVKLADFSDDDHLLLIGNPALIGISVAVAAFHNHGRVRLLQWSGRDQGYIPINVRGLLPDES